MSRLPALTPSKLIKIIKKASFVYIRQKGSHRIFRKGDRLLVIPYHNRDLKRPTLKGIIEQAGMTEKEFIELL